MIEVLVVDDNAMVRAGVSAALNQADDIAVVGECVDGDAVVAAAFRLRPQVVVMDVSMPRLDGIEATLQLQQAFPSARVVVLTASVNAGLVRRAQDAGASGYVIKGSDAAMLVAAVRSTARGEQAWGREAVEALRHGR
jgi:DNA-binding NarL/FixJ family response regulator